MPILLTSDNANIVNYSKRRFREILFNQIDLLQLQNGTKRNGALQEIAQSFLGESNELSSTQFTPRTKGDGREI